MRHVAQNDGLRVDADVAVTGLSEAGAAELLRALIDNQGRIASAIVDGKRVWIKRYDKEGRGVAKWLHAAGSRLPLHPFLRSSPWLSPEGQAERELRKSAAFRAAGFATPDVHYGRGAVIVSAHREPIVANRLKELLSQPAAHDALLVQCADALGQAHAAGLCHGRPHPRDMFLEDGKIGFLDFEEEPEAVMPLEVAQARDAWLLLQQIAGKTLTKGADAVAFDAWRQHASPAAIAELARASRLFSPVTTLLDRVASLITLSGDARRIRHAGLLLRKTFNSNQTGAQSSAPIGKSTS